jgi:hypothetical protein
MEGNGVMPTANPNFLTIEQITGLAETEIIDVLEDMKGDLRRHGHKSARLIAVSVDVDSPGVTIEVKP